MLIRMDPVYLCLTSTETKSEPFTLNPNTQMYYVHRIDSPHGHNTVNEIKVRSRPRDSNKEWENEIVYSWNEHLQGWDSSNPDDNIRNNSLMEYQVIADNPGAIIYITDTHNPHPRHDVIYLMADSIVSLEYQKTALESSVKELSLKIRTLERAVFEDTREEEGKPDNTK